MYGSRLKVVVGIWSGVPMIGRSAITGAIGKGDMHPHPIMHVHVGNAA